MELNISGLIYSTSDCEVAETSLQVGVEIAATIPESEPLRRKLGHSGEEEVRNGTLQKAQGPLMREKWS